MDIKEFIINEKVRGDCYRFLSACFYYPKKEIFIQEGLFENLTGAFKKVCPDAAIFSGKMAETILNYTNEELLIDYSNLFVGPYELKAPPYGSVYLDSERRVMGNSTMETLKIYQEKGLNIDNDFREMPDHIAVELEFMYYLTYSEAEALEKNEAGTALDFLRTQEIFLNKFLGQWAPIFCKKIIEGTDNKFYSALAGCLLTYLSACNLPENIQALAGEINQKVLDIR